MVDFHVNQRFDPYRNYKFRIKLDGKYVAGMTKMSAPSTTLRRTEHGPISLEYGITHDSEFQKWANKVRNPSAVSSSDFALPLRKNIVIEVFSEAGKLAAAYKIYNCWISEYQALPDLDANANAVAIQHIKVENEGWEQDTGATEPDEPTL
jgi:phage tail-like protein